MDRTRHPTTPAAGITPYASLKGASEWSGAYAPFFYLPKNPIALGVLGRLPLVLKQGAPAYAFQYFAAIYLLLLEVSVHVALLLDLLAYQPFLALLEWQHRLNVLLLL